MIDRKELAHLKKLISYIFVTEIFYRSFNLLFMSFFFFFLCLTFSLIRFSGIRNNLLDSEEHICLSCQQSVSPDDLVTNKFLRQVEHVYDFGS